MRLNLISKLILFCIGLIVVRVLKTGNPAFIFLLWNLFLAWLPWLLIRSYKTTDAAWKRFGTIILTVLFLPNAPYIITDLFHLRKNLSAPMWFDLVLLLSCAFAGLMYFLLSFERILFICRSVMPRLRTIWKPALLLATGYGIYLGRYLRFNSWDVFVRPFNFAEEMLSTALRKHVVVDSALFTITFALFLYLFFEIYISFRNRNGLTQNEFPS